MAESYFRLSAKDKADAFNAASALSGRPPHLLEIGSQRNGFPGTSMISLDPTKLDMPVKPSSSSHLLRSIVHLSSQAQIFIRRQVGIPLAQRGRESAASGTMRGEPSSRPGRVAERELPW
jgi:hypothetical protein